MSGDTTTRQPVAHERRRLEAERLAAAGRQHDDRVAPGEDRVHGFALQRPERRVAPVLLKHRQELVHGLFRRTKNEGRRTKNGTQNRERRTTTKNRNEETDERTGTTQQGRRMRAGRRRGLAQVSWALALRHHFIARHDQSRRQPRACWLRPVVGRRRRSSFPVLRSSVLRCGSSLSSFVPSSKFRSSLFLLRSSFIMFPMLTETPPGLYCAAGDFFIDPWDPVARAVITHAHGDHARPGSAAYLCTADWRRCCPGGSGRTPRSSRWPTANARARARRASASIPPATCSAPHRSGSRVPAASGSWPATTSARPDPTCAPFEPVPATPSSPNRPSACRSIAGIRPAIVIDDIMSWWRDNAARGRTSVIFCYTLGKAQRLLAELALVTDAPCSCTA